jgi:hypothetical protein
VSNPAEAAAPVKSGQPPPIVLTSAANLIQLQKQLKDVAKQNFTFYPKADKPIKAVIRHLPINTPAEDIVEGLVDIGFDVISVR